MGGTANIPFVAPDTSEAPGPTQFAPTSAAQPPASPMESSSTPPAPDAPAAQPAAQPSAVTVTPGTQPRPQSMLTRISHGILSALGGANDVQLSRNDDGTMVASSVAKTPGAQWKQIIAGALTGLAASGNAGVGPGSVGRGLALGTGAGLKMSQDQDKAKVDAANQDYDEQQKTLVRKAQLQQMAVQTAASSFSLERNKVDASELDAKMLNDHNKWIQDGGGTDVGTFKDYADVSAYAKNDPSLAADIAHGRVNVTPHVEDGKVTGIDVARVPEGWGQSLLTEDRPMPRQVPGKDGKPPTWTTETVPAGTMSHADYNAAFLAQTAAQAKQLGDASEETYKKEQEKNMRSEETQHYAEANKANAEADAAKNKVDPNDPQQVATLGEEIARGGLTEDQIPGFAKVKPAIQAYLAQHHPNLNQDSVFVTGAERKQADLANNAIHNLDDISTRLQRRPDLIGKINGLISQGKELTGTDDRDLADVNTALDNYALASTGAHGIRAVQARADAKKALLNGFKNGPNGIAASMQAARGSLQNLASTGKPRGLDGSPYTYNQQQGTQPRAKAPIAAPTGAPAGATQVWQDAKGAVVGYTVNGKYQAK
jgi:hypothetical protein